ncbi:MAG TPA: hypothetical protein VMU81_19305 [Acetobacteraceae bacterium]|nr:hypothetical protein [Acetobacteraceae bacterium]
MSSTTRYAMSEVVHAFNLRTIVVAAAVLIVLMASSFSAGYWAHGDRLMVPARR